jgi:hypothetical protein
MRCQTVRNFTIRILGGLFNFGVKRGYCVENQVGQAHSNQGKVESIAFTFGEILPLLPI